MRSLFLPNSWIELCVCCCVQYQYAFMQSYSRPNRCVCVCVVCVGARACSLSRSPPRAGVLSQNWIQLYVLNPTFSTPEVRLCTRTHLTHTITHSLMHTTLAILSHITWTYHVKLILNRLTWNCFQAAIVTNETVIHVGHLYEVRTAGRGLKCFCFCISERVKWQADLERLLTWSFVFFKQKVREGEDVFSILKKFGMSKK
jgi:hypothetical protein